MGLDSPKKGASTLERAGCGVVLAGLEWVVAEAGELGSVAWGAVEDAAWGWSVTGAGSEILLLGC